VLVGPNLLPEEGSKALRAAGVVTLGARKPDELVGYLQHADVLIVPHIVDGFTDSLDPIKLYEYQAVGRPVVSTPVAGFRDVVDERVVVADAAEFASAVRGALGASHGFPAGADREVPDWSVRVEATHAVLARLPTA
jgi:glycosyltransferase involved in cell wall biosynthesis